MFQLRNWQAGGVLLKFSSHQMVRSMLVGGQFELLHRRLRSWDIQCFSLGISKLAEFLSHQMVRSKLGVRQFKLLHRRLGSFCIRKLVAFLSQRNQG